MIAARRAANPPAPKAYAESLERLGLWPKLDHHLGVNDFFCALAAYRNPARLRAAGRGGGAGEVSGLTQWWSEHRCTEFFWKHEAGRETRLRPDGYGCWEEQGHAVRFFLEHDTGTESLTKVTRKIADYSDYPTDRFGVLLFSVHSTKREIALRAALRHALAGDDPGFMIATAVRDHNHSDGPAGPIWGLWTPHGDDTVSRRYRLAGTARTRPPSRTQRNQRGAAVHRGGVRPAGPGDPAPRPHGTTRACGAVGLDAVQRRRERPCGRPDPLRRLR